MLLTLQNSRVTDFAFFELLRENQLRGWKLPPPLHPRLPQIRFKRTINLNKYQSKKTAQVLKPNLDYLIEPGVNRPFVLSFENPKDRTVHTKYYLPIVETKAYIVMTDGQNFLLNQ